MYNNFQISGPELYHNGTSIDLWEVTMVTSPDEKGVIIIGGRMSRKFNLNAMFEMRLTGTTTLGEFKFEWQELNTNSESLFSWDRVNLTDRLGMCTFN